MLTSFDSFIGVIRIEASSGLSEDEIKRMKAEAEAHADQDKKAKEEVEKINNADGMIFQSEKNLKDYGDKIPADKKSRIEEATKKLKEAHQAKNISALEGLMNELNEAWHAASEEMAKAAGAQQGPNPGAGTQDGYGQNTGSTGNSGSNGKDGEVTDVDFEEVK